MRVSKLGFWLQLGLVLLAVAGCSSSTTFNPTPILSGIFPSSATAGTGSFAITVQGLQFIQGSEITWNGTQLSSTYNTVTEELTATVSAQMITQPGTAEVAVFTPMPGGGTSSGMSFFILASSSPAPQITSISPTGIAPGTSGFTLTVNDNATGSSFVSTSVVLWNGQQLVTTFVSSSQLTAQVPAFNIAAAGTAQISVSTPSPGGGVSSSVPFSITTNPTSATTVVSVAANGGAADAASTMPRVDSSGRFVAFLSDAHNLVGNSASGNVFVRDTCVGSSSACTAQTQAVDTAADGASPNGAALGGLAISATGRFVAFTSTATNLIAGGTKTSEAVFLRDTCFGLSVQGSCTPKTTLVSVASGGEQFAEVYGSPSVSDNGRYVAFSASGASSTASSSTPVAQVLVRDTCIGVTPIDSCSPQTVLVSVNSSGQAGSANSLAPSVSQDGRFVAFQSDAANLTDENTYEVTQVFLRDTCLGTSDVGSCSPSTSVISIGPDSMAGKAMSVSPSMAANARFVAFSSLATELAAGMQPAVLQVLVRDTCIGADLAASCAPSTIVGSSATGASPAMLIGVTNVQTVATNASGTVTAFSAKSASGAPANEVSGKGDIFLTQNPAQ